MDRLLTRLQEPRNLRVLSKVRPRQAHQLHKIRRRVQVLHSRLLQAPALKVPDKPLVHRQHKAPLTPQPSGQWHLVRKVSNNKVLQQELPLPVERNQLCRADKMSARLELLQRREQREQPTCRKVSRLGKHKLEFRLRVRPLSQVLCSRPRSKLRDHLLMPRQELKVMLKPETPGNCQALLMLSLE